MASSKRSTPIPFPVSSSPGINPEEGGGRIINAFAVQNPQGSRSPTSWRRSPGLRQVIDATPSGEARGLFWLPAVEGRPETLFVFIDDTVTLTQEAVGPLVGVGPLAGTGPVSAAANNNLIPDMVAVTSDGAFSFFIDAAPVPFADADLPANPSSVTNHRGYFLWTFDDGTIYSSGLNDATVDALAFTVGAGKLTRGVSYGDDFIAFGESFFEIYRDAGLVPFPLQFSNRVPRGLLSPFAIAGYEHGSTQDLMWVADNDTVVRYNGANMPTVISTDDVSRAIAAVADKTALIATIYSVDGHTFWTLSNGSEWTWEYNNKTKQWNERQSDSAAWRVAFAARAFDVWMALDRTTGAIYVIDSAVYDEEGNALIVTVESGIVAQFPDWFGVPRADFDITTGVNDAVTPLPTVNISWSDDGGFSFGTEVERSLVPLSATGRDQVTVRRTGRVRSKGKRFRLRVSDPVHVVLMGGTLNGTP